MSPLAPVQPLIHLGVYDHLVDEKRRTQVPAKWRPSPTPEGAEDYNITLMEWEPFPGLRCIMALPPRPTLRLVERLGDLRFGDPDAESLRRVLGRGSDVVTLDRAGRISLPARLLEWAGITNRAKMVGMVECFQLWNPESYALVEPLDERKRQHVMRLI
jgi:MraZ protein